MFRGKRRRGLDRSWETAFVTEAKKGAGFTFSFHSEGIDAVLAITARALDGVTLRRRASSSAVQSNLTAPKSPSQPGLPLSASALAPFLSSLSVVSPLSFKNKKRNFEKA